MLTYKRLRNILYYDPKTGIWTWLVTSGKAYKNQRAGRVRIIRGKPIRKIGIDNKQYRSARLAHFYMKQRWPLYEIDHIDGNSANDMWTNLRQATHLQNTQNVQKHRDNTLGYKGLSFHRNGKRIRKYQARIRAFGKTYSLGYFLTPQEAAEAYHKAEIGLRGQWRNQQCEAERNTGSDTTKQTKVSGSDAKLSNKRSA